MTVTEAQNSLKERAVIVELLKSKKINPKEADLLEHILKYSQGEHRNSIVEVRNLCELYFPHSHEEAFRKINRFVISEDKRVSWVIFSRTFQSIPYEDKNPLDDYLPRISEVLTIRSTYKAIR